MNKPIIKWTGSKTTQSDEIIKYFPKEIDKYYESFCGGCSILKKILDNKDKIKINQYICNDINKDLISLWNIIKDNPDTLYNDYKNKHKELINLKDINSKKEYYYIIRSNYNNNHSPLDLFFLMRTCINGMPRYNNKGKFNSPFHLNRNGIKPNNLKPILYEWNELLNNNNVKFISKDYKEIMGDENDFFYLDPPYANTKRLYFGNFNNLELFDYLNKLKSKFILSYNGKKSNNIDLTYDVPKNIYNKHIYIKSGNSSFSRLKTNNKNCIIYESLYIKNQI